MNMNEYYAVERHDGKRIALAESRHEAAGVIARCHAGKESWYDIKPVSAASWLFWRPVYTTNFDRYNEVWA